MARLVRGAAVASVGEAEPVRRLRGAGVLLRPRYGQGGTTEVVGYSVALRPVEGEEPVWFGGGRLTRDLALPALRAGWGATEAVDEALAEWAGNGTGAAPGRETRQLSEAEWANAAGKVDLAVERLAGVPAGERARWAAVVRETAGVFGAWSARVEALVPGTLARAAATLGWSAQEHELTGAEHWREPAARDFRGVASVVAQSAIRADSAMGWVLLMRSMVRTVEEIRQAHQARGEALQAARLAQLVTVELRQLEARLQRQAALVGARGEASKAQPERARGPLTIGDLLDASDPPLPLAGAGDLGPEELARRHWDQPGPERDVERG